MALLITYNAPIVKKVVLLVVLVLQMLCPVLADQAYGSFGGFRGDRDLKTNFLRIGFTLWGSIPGLMIR